MSKPTAPNEALRFGAPLTSTALNMLLDASVDHLTAPELEYLTRMVEHAELQTTSLASAMMTLGCFYSNAEKISEPAASETAEIIWNLSHQLDHISGLMSVSSEAAFQLKKRREQNPQA